MAAPAVEGGIPCLDLNQGAKWVLRIDLKALNEQENEQENRPKNTENNPYDKEQAANYKQLQGYQLRVTPREIHIQATTIAGVFYALQTLRQLEEQGCVSCCIVKDEPKYAYRGLMLDCSRHYWPKEFILKQLDAMAYLKMNQLHLHLTDDAGWRMEILQYPALTEKTAWRVGEKLE